jgi:hypothetical protein
MGILIVAGCINASIGCKVCCHCAGCATQNGVSDYTSGNSGAEKGCIVDNSGKSGDNTPYNRRNPFDCNDLRGRAHVLSIMPIKVYHYDTLLPILTIIQTRRTGRVNNR